MRIEVLGNLPWNTSREAVKKSVVWTVVEEYGRHVLFKAGSQYHCVLLVPGNGNVDADRRPPHLLVDIDAEPDPSCDESQFSYAMQDEVRSVRNTIMRKKIEDAEVEAVGNAIFYAMGGKVIS